MEGGRGGERPISSSLLSAGRERLIPEVRLLVKKGRPFFFITKNGSCNIDTVGETQNAFQCEKT